MPIRMVDDPRDPDENSGDDSGGGGFGRGGGGDGGGLFGILLLLLGLFRGRGLFVLLLIGIIGYFFLGRGGCHGIGGADTTQKLFTGGFLNPRQFEKANIYESLSDDTTKNPLPEAANL
ncbi:MAG TPA: hypothetical protein VG605_01555, partial [Puia sp.]|nr:hypothetical protein [Puia sp.]